MLTSRSILIAIEGIDGGGKTTQVRLLREALERAHEAPVVSREPTDGIWGKLIRESATKGRLSLEAELSAFVNDRAEHVQNLVSPALGKGQMVILDRYFYSTVAYQGARGGNVAEIKTLMENRFPIPDSVFVIDIDPKVGLQRISNSRSERPDHFEQLIMLEQAREVFGSLGGAHIHHIDGSMTREDVHSTIIDRFVHGALKAKRCARSYDCGCPPSGAERILETCEWLRLARGLGVV